MKKTEKEKFMYQLRKPDSKIRKIIDFFITNDIVGYNKAIKKQVTSEKIMKVVKIHYITQMCDLLLKINRYMESVKIVSRRYNWTKKVYFIPSGFDKRSFDEEKNNIIGLQKEIKSNVDKYIEERMVIAPIPEEKLIIKNGI